MTKMNKIVLGAGVIGSFYGAKLSKLTDILIVYTIPRTKEQKSSLEIVIKTLKKHNINFSIANRDKLKKKQFKNKDLVIAVGGDGTFLRASQFVGNQLIFGVNADIKNKEGFFMQTHKKNFESKFRRITKNDFFDQLELRAQHIEEVDALAFAQELAQDLHL